MYGLYQLALLDICMINIGSVIGIGRFWQKYNRYRYNQKLPYRYISNVHTVLLQQFILQLRKILYIDNSTHHYVELSQTGHIEV